MLSKIRKLELAFYYKSFGRITYYVLDVMLSMGWFSGVGHEVSRQCRVAHWALSTLFQLSIAAIGSETLLVAHYDSVSV